MQLENQLWITLFYLLFFADFLQGQYDRNKQQHGKHNDGQQTYTQNSEKHSSYDYSRSDREGSNKKEGAPEFCFDKAKREVLQLLGFCKCEVYERYKTFVGPNMSSLFQTIGEKMPPMPNQGGSGGKKKCRPKGPMLEALYKVQKYGFYQVKTCLWNQLTLIKDGQAKWENLIHVLDKFDMPDEKKENITKSIENCKENTSKEEEEEESKADDDEEFDIANVPLKELASGDLFKKIMKKVLDAAEKSKMGGMNKADYKIGTCIKEKLDMICDDFQTSGGTDYSSTQGGQQQYEGGGDQQRKPGGGGGGGKGGGGQHMG